MVDEESPIFKEVANAPAPITQRIADMINCVLYKSDADDDQPCGDLGGQRNIIKKKTLRPKLYLVDN